MFSNQHFRHGFATMLAILLLTTQVGFLLVHHHDEQIYHADDVEQHLTLQDSDNQISQSCSLCEQFFSQSADLATSNAVTITSGAVSFYTAYSAQCDQVCIQYDSSRAPPAIG